MKRKGVDEFPFCLHLVSWEKENVSSEAQLFNLNYESNLFTKFGHNDYLKFKSEHRIVPDGVNAKVMWSCSTMQYTVVETVWHINSIMLRMFLLVNLHLGECIQLCFGIKFASSIGSETSLTGVTGKLSLAAL
ncbi:60S ribosomal protein L10-3 [Glycine soja]